MLISAIGRLTETATMQARIRRKLQPARACASAPGSGTLGRMAAKGAKNAGLGMGAGIGSQTFGPDEPESLAGACQSAPF